jgi:hypothetical protein
MSTTSVTFIRQAFELTAPDDPARGEIGAEAVAILVRARQFDDAAGFAGTLLAAPIPSDIQARVRLLLLPRLWSTGRRAELGALAGVDEPSESSVRGPGPSVAPELVARLAGYRALAEGVTVAAVSAADTAIKSAGDPVAGVLATVAAAEQAERDGDYARTRELFAAAWAGAQETAGVGLPEAGQLAARELLALARLDAVAKQSGTAAAVGWPTEWRSTLRMPEAITTLPAAGGTTSRTRCLRTEAARLDRVRHCGSHADQSPFGSVVCPTSIR